MRHAKRAYVVQCIFYDYEDINIRWLMIPLYRPLIWLTTYYAHGFAYKRRVITDRERLFVPLSWASRINQYHSHTWITQHNLCRIIKRLWLIHSTFCNIYFHELFTLPRSPSLFWLSLKIYFDIHTHYHIKIYSLKMHRTLYEHAEWSERGVTLLLVVNTLGHPHIYIVSRGNLLAFKIS